MKILNFIILMSGLIFNISAHAQSDQSLVGVDITRAIAHKLGYSILSTRGNTCQLYSNSEDNNNVLRGSVSVISGNRNMQSRDAGFVEQLNLDISLCLLNLSQQKSQALIETILGKSIIQKLCSQEAMGAQLCPPTQNYSAQLEYITYLFTQNGQYAILKNTEFEKNLELQNQIVNAFIKHFLGPDAFLLEYMTRQNLQNFREDLRTGFLKVLNGSVKIRNFNRDNSILGLFAHTLMTQDMFTNTQY